MAVVGLFAVKYPLLVFVAFSALNFVHVHAFKSICGVVFLMLHACLSPCMFHFITGSSRVVSFMLDSPCMLSISFQGRFIHACIVFSTLIACSHLLCSLGLKIYACFVSLLCELSWFG